MTATAAKNSSPAIQKSLMANDDTALNEILARIEELGLNQNLLDLEVQGFTVLHGVLSQDQIDRAKAAILRRVESTTKNKIDPDQADAADFNGMVYQHY